MGNNRKKARKKVKQRFSESNVEKQLETDKMLINKSLRKYLEKTKGFSVDIFRAITYAVFPGGKRLRPILCLEACRCCTGNIKEALPAACAIEFVHNFSLIHDDLPSIDDDDFRRGKLSCHKKFGEATAILAGDTLLGMAFGLVSYMKDKDISIKLSRILSDAVGLKGMIGGQGLDIKYCNKRKTSILQSKINRLKTAVLFKASLAMGAAVARAPYNKMRKLDFFGERFGAAFQIYDDIQDNAHKKGTLRKKKTELKKLLYQAKSCLDIFGKKADNLRYITDMLKA